LRDLEIRVQEACQTARLVGKEETHLPPVEPVVEEIHVEMRKDFREIPLAEKKALIEEYNQIALGHHKNMQTTNSGYADSFKTIWYANNEGTYILEEQPDVFVYVMAVARDGDIVQRTYQFDGGAEGYQTVEGFQDKAREAANKAVDLLSAPPVTGGKYTVITNPEMTGVFTHEAFGHLSEADFVYENLKMQELMVLGKRFGVEGLNIIDDGSLPGGLGTHKYDYE